jgi:hypothetical protein
VPCAFLGTERTQVESQSDRRRERGEADYGRFRIRDETTGGVEADEKWPGNLLMNRWRGE